VAILGRKGAATVEARPGERELAEAFARIEAEVGRGGADLGALGFWPLVGRVKRDPALVERFADQVGRIDGAAFRSRVRFRLPVWVGNAVLLTEAAIGAAAIGVAAVASSETVTGIGLVVGGIAWAVGLHSPTHWLVGRLVGIRFTDYFLGGPPPRRPSLKIDYASYLRTPPVRRAVMHASGAISTKLAPFLALAAAPAYEAPTWSVVVLLVMGVGQIVTDVLFSTKTSDWKKVRRELRVAAVPPRR
jgi:hypothetical protein